MRSAEKDFSQLVRLKRNVRNVKKIINNVKNKMTEDIKIGDMVEVSSGPRYYIGEVKQIRKKLYVVCIGYKILLENCNNISILKSTDKE